MSIKYTQRTDSSGLGLGVRIHWTNYPFQLLHFFKVTNREHYQNVISKLLTHILPVTLIECSFKSSLIFDNILKISAQKHYLYIFLKHLIWKLSLVVNQNVFFLTGVFDVCTCICKIGQFNYSNCLYIKRTFLHSISFLIHQKYLKHNLCTVTRLMVVLLIIMLTQLVFFTNTLKLAKYCLIYHTYYVVRCFKKHLEV